MGEGRRADIIFVVVVAVVIASLTAFVVSLVLDGVTLSTRDSPLGEQIARIAMILGIIASVVPLMQARRIIQTQSARDISIIFLAVFTASYVMSIAMGVMLLMPAIYIPGILGTITATSTLATAIRMRWIWRGWDEVGALRLDDAAQGALIELDHEAHSPATLNEDTMPEDPTHADDPEH